MVPGPVGAVGPLDRFAQLTDVRRQEEVQQVLSRSLDEILENCSPGRPAILWENYGKLLRSRSCKPHRLM